VNQNQESAYQPELTHVSRTEPPLEEALKTFWTLGNVVLWSDRAARDLLTLVHPALNAATQSAHGASPGIQRAFLLRKGLPLLFKSAAKNAKTLTPPEQIMLDALSAGTERLDQFDGFFHRLEIEDQALLVLSDHVGIPFEQLGLCFEEPESSLRIRRQQALRALDDWIFANSAEHSGIQSTPASACFWIQSLLSEKSLEAHSEAKLHLRECPSCERKRRRTLLLLMKLEESGRAFEPFREHSTPGVSELTPQARPKSQNLWKSLWKILEKIETRSASPWFSRPATRSWLGIFAVLLLLLGLPRVRAIYETHLDRRLESYFAPTPLQVTPEELERASKDDYEKERREILGSSQGTGQSQAPSPSFDGTGTGAALSDSEDGEDAVEADEEGDTADSSTVGSLRGGVWRFHIKTHSPKELRQQIVSYLKKAALAAPGPAASGIEAPGGIQFDFIIPKSALGPLRDYLRSIAEARIPPAPQKARPNASLESAPFTWYRGRNATSLPAGQAKVIIWLSQI